MLNAINQFYVVGFSYIPGIQPGEKYHWQELVKAAAVNDMQTLSSKQNFFIYNADGTQKLMIATACQAERSQAELVEAKEGSCQSI